MADPVAVATVNATVIAIYEALLVLFLDRASKPRQELLRAGEETRKGFNVRRGVFDMACKLLTTERGAHELLSADAHQSHIYTRLERALRPGYVRKRQAYDHAQDVNFQSFSDELKETDRVIAKLVQNEGEQVAIEAVMEEEGLDEGDAKRRIALAMEDAGKMDDANEGGQSLPPRSSVVVLPPLDDTTRARDLRLALAAIVTQSPFPKRLFLLDGSVNCGEPQVPKLSAPPDIKLWAQGAKELALTFGLLDGCRDTMDSLRSVHPESRTSGDPISEEYSTVKRQFNERFPLYAASAVRWAYRQGLKIDALYSDWELARPTASVRTSLAVGLIAGAVLTLAGVVYPIVASSPWWWIYTVVPSTWFGVVAVAIALSGVRFSSRL
jgi:hypothetical protein